MVEGDARFDMVAEGSGREVVFEHKVWSALGTDTVSRYRALAKKRWPEGHRLVLVTGSKRQHDPSADGRLTWSEVHALIAEWLAAQPTPALHVADFLALLRAEGLGPAAPISEENIRSYTEGVKLIPRVAALLERAQSADWTSVYDSLGWLDEGQLTRRAARTRARRARKHRVERSLRARFGRQGLEEQELGQL